jgi:hypothetical protein
MSETGTGTINSDARRVLPPQELASHEPPERNGNLPPDNQGVKKFAEGVANKAKVGAYTAEDKRVAYERLGELSEVERSRHERAQKHASLLAELAVSDKDQPLSLEAQAYLDRGGRIEDLWEELTNYLEEPPPSIYKATDIDKDLAMKRKSYMKAVHKKDMPFRRTTEVDRQRDTAEKEYAEAVVAKLRSLSETPVDQALQAGYLPEVIEKLSFGPDSSRTIEDIAGNHMFVLVDVLAREKILRDEQSKKETNRGLRKVLRSVRSNNIYRGAVAATIFGAAALNMGGEYLPDAIEPIGEAAGFGLMSLSAGLASQNLLEGIEGGARGISGKRKRKKAEAEMASDQELADLALRTAYNSYEYQTGGREGVADEEENLKRFKHVETAFRNELMEGPGGEKPYTGGEVFAYASRLYLEHRSEVDAIAQADDPERAYHDLANIILEEDLEEMRESIRQNPIKKTVIGALSVVGAVAGNQVVQSADVAVVTAHGLTGKA